MTFNDGELGNIFDEDGEGKNAKGLAEVLEHITHLMTEHEMPVSLALDGLLNILQPGSTERSHDVKHAFTAAMFVQGFGEVADHVLAVWLTDFPWGIGFHFAFEPGYKLEAVGFEAKRAVVRSLCGVLQAGGITAEMTDNDRIKVTKENGKEQDIDIDSVVSQFRSEMDKELGPDAPVEPPTTAQESQEITDWMKRWLPDQ